MKTTKHIHLSLAILGAIATLAASAQAGPGGNTAPATAPRQSATPMIVVHTVRAAEPTTCPKCARIVATSNAKTRPML